MPIMSVLQRSKLRNQEKLKEEYNEHHTQKQNVREIKNMYKNSAENDPTHVAATFDLQQVLYLPITNHVSLFYSRRISNYTLTVYQLHIT